MANKTSNESIAAASEAVAGETHAIDEAAANRALMAENVIKNHVIGSIAASVVPIAIFDIAAVTGIQLRMIQKLAQLHGRTFSESTGRNIITALAGGIFGYGAGYVAASAVKMIPGIGWMAGMMSMPVLAGASTYAVGRSVEKHLQSGGTLADFKADDMRAYYEQQFEKGKEVAAKAKARAKTKADNAASPETEATAAG